LLFAFLLLPSLSVLAQGGTTGRIAGTIKDAKGAVIAEAEVTVASRATGEERTVIADTTGDYAVLLLTPGHYRVTIKASGFKQASSMMSRSSSLNHRRKCKIWKLET